MKLTIEIELPQHVTAHLIQSYLCHLAYRMPRDMSIAIAHGETGEVLNEAGKAIGKFGFNDPYHGGNVTPEMIAAWELADEAKR